ncbi:hypothetical protein N7504_002125 [Penicillium tannophilum]|nr:hypothetical protein N7504_002125 [Penicillium tannophilum]
MDVYGDYRVQIAHSSHSGTNTQAEFSTESQYLGQADNHSQIQETILSHSHQLSESFTAFKRIVTGLGRQNTRTQTQHIRLAGGVDFTAAHFLGTWLPCIAVYKRVYPSGSMGYQDCGLSSDEMAGVDREMCYFVNDE